MTRILTLEQKEAKRARFKAWQKTPAGIAHKKRSHAAYAKRHPEKFRAYGRAWHATNSVEINARGKLYRIDNRDRIAERKRLARLKVSAPSVFIVRRSPEDTMRAVHAALPSGLPPFIRDDVASAMMLAILEGQLQIEDVGRRAREYLRGYNREHDHFKTWSLDVPVGDGGMTFKDMLVDGEGMRS